VSGLFDRIIDRIIAPFGPALIKGARAFLFSETEKFGFTERGKSNVAMGC
jgi:hypothetical protein